MSISRLAAGILVVPLIFAACGRGTSPAPEQATTAAAPNSQVLMQLRSDWQAQKDTMMKIADAMPENKFGYKSTPAQRNYGEQIMHVASSNVELLKVLGGNAAALPLRPRAQRRRPISSRRSAIRTITARRS